MRFVIFDDETMEPITVVNLPGIGERDIWDRMNGRIRLPLPAASDFLPVEAECRRPRKSEDVELWFERFIRNGQMTLMCFTSAGELALLLEPDFLPGQRRSLRALEDRSKRLADIILGVLSR